MAKLSPLYQEATLDDDGNLAVGWKIYTYVAGSSTPATTYTSELAGTPQENPIELNARGEPDSPIWLTEGVSYKFELTDENDVVKRTIDDVDGVNDNFVDPNQWIAGPTPTYISSNSFTLVGDQRTDFHNGRALKLLDSLGTNYSHIFDVSYTPSVTTVTITDSVLDSGLSEVSLGFVTAEDSSLPSVIFADTTFKGDITFEKEDDGAEGPVTTYFHESNNPAALDVIQTTQYDGRNQVGSRVTYAESSVSIVDRSTGSEDGAYAINTIIAGSLGSRLVVGAGLYTPSATGGDKGVDTINAATLYQNGVGVAPIITLSSPVATTSGTSVSLSTTIPSYAKRITLSFIGVSTNGTSELIIQIGPTGGLETSSYLSSAAVISDASTTVINGTNGFAITGSGAAAAVYHGTITLCLADSSTNTWTSSGTLGRSDADVVNFSGGSKALAGVLTRVSLTTVGGANTFDAGSIGVSYQ